MQDQAPPADFDAVMLKVKTQVRKGIWEEGKGIGQQPCNGRPLVTQVAKERVRLYEHMRSFDKLRTGVITLHQFRSGLSMAKFSLTVPELLALEQHYGAAGGSGVVRYTQFCRDVEAVFAQEGLHMDPLALPQPVRALARRRRGGGAFRDRFGRAKRRALRCMQFMTTLTTSGLPPKEAHPAVEQQLKAMADLVVSRRLLLERDFKAYDRVHRGVGESWLPRFRRWGSGAQCAGTPRA